MKIKRDTSKEILLLIIIFLFVLSVRMLVLFHTDDFHGVAAGKVLLAEKIIKNDLAQGEWYTPVHPPAHMAFLVLALNIVDDPLFVPRLISLFFGSFLVLPFFYYIKYMFNFRTAVFSTVALAVYSMHIAYSVIATSETMFHFFLFSSFLLYVLFKRQKNYRVLYSSALMLGVAILCRYEGLLFIPLFFIFLKKDFKESGLFLVIVFLLPLIWMMVNWRYSLNGDPLMFLNTNDFTVPKQFNWIRSQGVAMGFRYKLLFWPRSLGDTLGWPVFISGILGVIHCLRQKEKRFAVLGFFFVFFIFIFRTIQEFLYLQPRYGITLGLMLIPFSINFIIVIMREINTKVFAWSMYILILSMIPCFINVVRSEPLYIPHFAKDVAGYLRDNIRENENIIMDHCSDEKYRDPIKVLSTLNPKQFVLTPYLVVKDGRWCADIDKFFEILENYDIDILVYSPFGDIGAILELEEKDKVSVVRGVRFELLYSKSPYCIYRVEKAEEKGNK
ncbi:MAG: glycosyltransferase family 39 protein [PVC group bacterium]|nr:glycosyltransferase family 39 protein [PVC group bacterium]